MKRYILFLLTALFILSCSNMTKSDYPAENEILLTWEFLGNSDTEWKYNAVFTLENQSNDTLGNSGWALYFSQMGRGVVRESVTGPVQIEHVNGDLVRILPTADFLLAPGEKIEISYNKPGRLLKENEAPLGPYMVYSDANEKEIAAVAIEQYRIKPVTSLDMVFPGQSDIPLPDAGWVFEQNRDQALLPVSDLERIIPTPEKVKYFQGKVTLGEGWMIHHDEGLNTEAEYLAEMLEQVRGAAPAVMQSSTGGPHIIRLIADPDKIEGEEAYELVVNPEDGIIISGGGSAGVFYGVQSLLALAPVEAWQNPQEELEFESVEIFDQPAFGYRGMHLDISRNYLEPAAIKKLVQVMAFYKMNTLHLHLTDDEGWRLEIPSLPELTEVGAFRGHTLDNSEHLYPNFGSGPSTDPGSGYGSGFLSREAFIELLKFADDHHMEIIPEVNFPGHARAAIYAMENRYRRLMEEGKEEEALEYRLIDTEDQSRYNSAQNFDDNVICVCQEAPYRFYETVVDEIIAMYEEAGLKLRVFHAGGDEVPHGSWTGSPVCEEFLRNHPEIGGAENLQPYFEGRLFEILEERNLVMGGWEEVAMKKNKEGIWIPNPEFVGKDMLPYVWNNMDENLDLGNRLANAGYSIILCNATNLYFDFGYNHHPQEPGHYWGGLVNTRRAFEMVPFDVFRSTLYDRYWEPIDTETAFEGMESLDPSAYKNIVGIQGELWSEFIKGGEMLEYFYMPKILGLVERAWAGQAFWGEIENREQQIAAMGKAWNAFANVVGQREMPRLDYLFGGFNYRLPPPGVMINEGLLHVNIDFPGLTIRYTTDGTEPGTDAPVYTGPVEVSGPVRVRSFDTRGRGSRISLVE